MNKIQARVRLMEPGYRAQLEMDICRIAKPFLPDKEMHRIALEKGLPWITAQTMDSEERLMAEVARIRQDGYAVDDMEHEEHLRCVGAPIRNARGEVFASLSLSPHGVREIGVQEARQTGDMRARETGKSRGIAPRDYSREAGKAGLEYRLCAG